jgi:hypothetical protein
VSLARCSGYTGWCNIHQVQLHAAIHGTGHKPPVVGAGQEADPKDVGQVLCFDHKGQQIALGIVPEKNLIATTTCQDALETALGCRWQLMRTKKCARRTHLLII